LPNAGSPTSLFQARSLPPGECKRLLETTGRLGGRPVLCGNSG